MTKKIKLNIQIQSICYIIVIKITAFFILSVFLLLLYTICYLNFYLQIVY